MSFRFKKKSAHTKALLKAVVLLNTFLDMNISDGNIKDFYILLKKVLFGLFSYSTLYMYFRI